MRDPLAPHAASPTELKERMEAENGGMPLLVYRGPADEQRLVRLDGSATRLTIGRAETNAVPLPWDNEVSRVHAELELVGGQWTVWDDGLSRNGTLVNGADVEGRQRLRDGDLIEVGHTIIAFRAPGLTESGTTVAKRDSDGAAVFITPAQRRVLVALCRPYKDLQQFATPATNQEIAEQVYLSVDAVKAHLRALFNAFQIHDLPQNQKRVRLAELAFERGILSRSEL